MEQEVPKRVNLKKHYYLSKDCIDYIDTIKYEEKTNASKALEQIIEEHKAYKAKEQSAINTDELIENIDSNTQILIEMLNFFMVNNAKESDTTITTDQFKSPMLILAEKEIERKILLKKHKK